MDKGNIQGNANGVYSLNKKYGDAKYNANYLRKVRGSEAPPPKAVKPGGMLDRARRASKAVRKDYSGRVEQRKTRDKRKKPRRYKAVPAKKQVRKQKYKVGTKVSKLFDGVPFRGVVKSWDKTYYSVL